MLRLLPWALLLTSLLPSAWFAFSARELPQLGSLPEDSLYLSAGLSLADGRGYRLASVPGEPAQTRVPPLFPAYLAPFANNRTLLSWMLWVLAPTALALIFFWARQQGWQHWQAALLCLLMGSNVSFVMASANLLPDLLTLALLLAAVYALEQDSRAAAVLATIAASGAYLTSVTLLIPLSAMIPLLLFRRRYAQAAIFSVGLLATAWWWRSFVDAHADPSAQGLASWYLNAPSKSSFGFVNGNLVALAEPGLLALGLAAAYGWYRVRAVSMYPAFGVVYVVAMLLHQEVPQARTLLPILPLLLAGLVMGLSSLPRYGTVATAVVAVVLVSRSGLPLRAAYDDLQRFRAFHPLRSQAYFWIDANTPANARFLASDDAMLHTVTHRHGFSLHPSSRLSRAALIRFFGNAPLFARAEGLDYILFTPNDYSSLLTATERLQVQAQVEADTSYQTVYASDGVVVKRRSF